MPLCQDRMLEVIALVRSSCVPSFWTTLIFERTMHIGTEQPSQEPVPTVLLALRTSLKQ
jgi:hypothetical protein